jgi:hypothetical protein
MNDFLLRVLILVLFVLPLTLVTIFEKTIRSAISLKARVATIFLVEGPLVTLKRPFR